MFVDLDVCKRKHYCCELFKTETNKDVTIDYLSIIDSANTSWNFWLCNDTDVFKYNVSKLPKIFISLFYHMWNLYIMLVQQFEFLLERIKKQFSIAIRAWKIWTCAKETILDPRAKYIPFIIALRKKIRHIALSLATGNKIGRPSTDT